MRKIIKNKVYDTSTARLQGEWWNGYSRTDFKYMQEDLYLKKTGEFFLYASGGALTKYAEHTAQGMAGNDVIKPLTYEEARQWAEEKLEAEEYEAIFGMASEDEGGEVALHFAVPAWIYDRMGQDQQKTGKQYKEIVTEILEAHYKNVE